MQKEEDSQEQCTREARTDSQKGPEIVEQKDSSDIASLARTIPSSTPSFDIAPASA